MPSNEGLRRQPPPGKVGGGGEGVGTSRSLPLKSVELARRRENAQRRHRCIMPLARKLDMTEFKAVSHFPRYGIIMYAVRIVKF